MRQITWTIGVNWAFAKATKVATASATSAASATAAAAATSHIAVVTTWARVNFSCDLSDPNENKRILSKKCPLTVPMIESQLVQMNH